MFKVTSRQHGTYYCRTQAQALELRADRSRLHNETGYRIVEYKRDALQCAADHLMAFTNGSR